MIARRQLPLALLVSSLLTASFTSHADAHDAWSGARPDGHAPIGVMGEHRHGAGEWMLSYRYMFMEMDGNRIGSDRVGTGRVLEDFMVSPTKMTMRMHMFGLMVAPIDRVTLMFMAPLVSLEMDHVTRMGGTFTTETEGLGDVGLMALVGLFGWERNDVHLNLGLRLPTGTIDATDRTPMGPRSPLPYPMQLGSGTLDVVAGLTYLGQTDALSWGFQNLNTVRTGENDADYTLGNKYELTAWGAAPLGNWVSLSARLAGTITENIDGADGRLNPMVIPTARTDLRGGERLDLLGGMNFQARDGLLKGHRLAVEAGFPLYQSLDGPQLETDFVVTVGWQYAFSLPPTAF